MYVIAYHMIECNDLYGPNKLDVHKTSVFTTNFDGSGSLTLGSSAIRPLAVQYHIVFLIPKIRMLECWLK